MSIFAIIFTALSFLFGLIFLIDCIRYRKQINEFVKYGICLGLILVSIDIAIYYLISNYLSDIHIVILVLSEFLSLVQITIFTCMGMYICKQLNFKDIPFVRSFFEKSYNINRNYIFQKRFLVYVFSVIYLSVAYSIILFSLTSPEMSQTLKHMSESQLEELPNLNKPSFLAALVVLEFAFAEEIIFRLGIQNYIQKMLNLIDSQYWISISLTSLFWSFAHANVLDPEWVKIVQIFPIGLGLGYLFNKVGTEACILAHGFFNIIMMFLTPYLFTI